MALGRSRSRRDAESLSVRVVSLEEREDGWHAVLSFHGMLFDVDRVQGSWRTTPENPGDSYHELIPSLCAELQRRVRKIERKRGANQAVQ